MIYGHIIREQYATNQLNNIISSPLEIMQEYYENEISLYKSALEYKDNCIGESYYELQSLEEGFVGNIIEKIKEIIKNFIDWIKGVFKAIGDFFKKDSSSESGSTEEKLKKNKEEAHSAKTETEVKTAAKKACLQLTEGDSQTFPVTVKRYDVSLSEFMDDDMKGFMDGDIAAMAKELDSEISKLKNESLEDMKSALEDIEEEFEEYKEMMNHFNYQEEFDKKFLKEYTFNSYDELNRATLRFIEHDEKIIKEIKACINKLNSQQKEIINLFSIIDRKISNLTDVDSKIIEMTHKIINTFIAFSRLALSDCIKMLRYVNSRLVKQIK